MLMMRIALWALLAVQPTNDAASEASAGTDWPQWRGPARDSICKETGLLPAWPEGGPPLLWTSKERGTGYSTPTVSAGRIFGMGNRGSDEVVWALDEATGKEVWGTRIGRKLSPRESGGYEGPRCSPTVVGDRVYALAISGALACFDAASGKILWSKSMKDDFGGKMMSVWGYSESPTVDGDRLIVTPGGDSTMVALNRQTGEVIWKTADPDGSGAGYGSVATAHVGGKKIYLNWLGDGLIGVDAADGKLLFKYSKIANQTANIPTPVVRGDYVFTSTGYNDGGSALLHLVAQDGKIEAQEVWSKKARELQNHHGGFVLVGDYLYFGHGHNDGKPVCVDFMTGKVAWGPERRQGKASAAVLFADGKLYFRWQDGVMGLIDANPKGYKLISTFKLPDPSGQPSWPHPVISHGKMYIRDQDKLLCYDVKAK